MGPEMINVVSMTKGAAYVCPICGQAMKRGTDREPIVVPDENNHATMICVPCADAAMN